MLVDVHQLMNVWISVFKCYRIQMIIYETVRQAQHDNQLALFSYWTSSFGLWGKAP